MFDIKEVITKKKKDLGINNKELADALGLGLGGEKLMAALEKGTINTDEDILNKILNFAPIKPFFQSQKENYKFSFIDLFAGIGGIRIPFQELGGYCAFTSEWDKFAQKTYFSNFGCVPHGDITQVQISNIPQHDILLAGFPCQAFSQAGLKKGFNDTRGTLFFEVQKILVHKRPAAFLLENVKQLKGHDRGKTLKTILDVLTGDSISEENLLGHLQISNDAKLALNTKLNYWVSFAVLKANQFGVPQKRERIYIVGFDKSQFPEDFNFNEEFTFPSGEPNEETCLAQILEKNKTVDEKYTLSDRLWQGHKTRKIEHLKRGNGFGYSLFNKKSPHTNTLSARYYKDGSEILISQEDLKQNPRKLTPRECARLQGYPKEFIIPVSDSQAYKQFGNSVAVPVIRAVAKEMMKTLEKVNSQKISVAAQLPQ
jgi:DNA (cytosine-5)-methyltransferase 1